MKLTNCLANFFVTYTITQTNVHDYSRSKSAQSVNENSYYYNSTVLFAPQFSAPNYD
ncbi:ferredoxin [Escherichia fergusonii]|nr:ferredoxin [Escherichia fergusonii]